MNRGNWGCSHLCSVSFCRVIYGYEEVIGCHVSLGSVECDFHFLIWSIKCFLINGGCIIMGVRIQICLRGSELAVTIDLQINGGDLIFLFDCGPSIYVMRVSI